MLRVTESITDKSLDSEPSALTPEAMLLVAILTFQKS